MVCDVIVENVYCFGSWYWYFVLVDVVVLFWCILVEWWEYLVWWFVWLYMKWCWGYFVWVVDVGVIVVVGGYVVWFCVGGWCCVLGLIDMWVGWFVCFVYILG